MQGAAARLKAALGLALGAVHLTQHARSVRAEAQRLLGFSPERLEHVTAVAGVAASGVGVVQADEIELLVAAAWLHDIGYASEVADTGFHPLDGARHLRSIGASERLCRLIANHTHAWVEAEARGLADTLAEEFPAEHSPIADALTYADLTTGPTGDRVAVEDRLAEILERYPAGHVVHESIRRASAELIATVRRVEARMAAAHPR